jgi:hypothetical protein
MDFRSRPEGTLIISPENQARAELNLLVHQELQREGRVRSEEQLTPVLVNRQELTGADREWAMRYEAGDWIRYSRGSQRLGIKPGEYVRVLKVNAADNTLTVQRSSGQTLTYDPRRLHGVTVYRETQRAFAPGDRVQFTAPCRERQVANRELGTLKTIDPKGQVIIQLDAGRSTIFNLSQYRHLDYGYAVTSHSSQGQTVDRALIYIDTEQTSPQALNSRLAYVAVSRARHEVRIYTNDIEKLAEALSRQTTKSSAVEAWQKGEEWEHSIHLPQPSLAPAAAQVAKPDSTRELAFNLQP